MDITKTNHNMEIYRATANLHFNYIHNGFLASLGIPFLTLLYKAIDKNKESVLIVKKVDERVIGFVSGSVGMLPIYKQLLIRPHRLLGALVHSIMSVSKIYKILEILLLNKSNSSLRQLPQEELLSIVVDPAYQGGGHAEKLFESLCNHFKDSGVEEFRIVVGANLARANAFYTKLGAIPTFEVELHKGQISTVYVKKC